MPQQISQKLKGIITIIGSCLLYLPVGSTYILGNINIYVSSYFSGVTSDETSIVFPITTIVGNIMVILSLPLCKLMGYRKMLILSTILTFVFIFTSTFCDNFWVFFVFFGVGYGGTTGFLYVNLLYNCYKYFPQRRGLIGGILMGIYGISSLISNYILLYSMNPDNVKANKDENTGEYSFPKEISDRLPGSLRILAYYFLGVMIIGNFLQFEYKEEPIKTKEICEESNNLKENLWKNSEINKENNQNSEDSIKNGDTYTSLSQIFRNKSIYLIIIMTFCSIQNGYFTATNFKNYGITKISDDSFLTLVGSLSCVCNGGGRFFWGLLSDKLHFKRVYLTILCIQIAEIATLRFVSAYKPTYLIWVCVALLCEGGHFVIFPVLNLEMFGDKLGGSAFSVVLLGIALANVTQFCINLGLRGLIGFENEFLIFLGLTVIALAVCCGFSTENKRKNEKIIKI